mgnify:FL=1
MSDEDKGLILALRSELQESRGKLLIALRMLVAAQECAIDALTWHTRWKQLARYQRGRFRAMRPVHAHFETCSRCEKLVDIREVE